MVIETWYAAGDGVLLGTGAHWLLLDAAPGPALSEELWAVLSGPRPGRRHRARGAREAPPRRAARRWRCST